VDIIGQSLHIRKLVVGVDIPVAVALAFPGVVDVDIDIETSASAAARTSASSTLPAKWFQLFQPIGGVATRVLSVACAWDAGTNKAKANTAENK
jgi:hypothetical protein